MKRTRRHHGAAFKTQVAFTAVKGEKTLAELATQFGVAAVQYTDDELLHRGSPRSAGQLWQSGHLQHGPRLPIHQPRIHGTPERPWHPDLYGRHRVLAG